MKGRRWALEGLEGYEAGMAEAHGDGLEGHTEPVQGMTWSSFH